MKLASLCGLGPVPAEKGAVANWLKRRGVPIKTEPARGGMSRVCDVADLPAEVRAALWARDASPAAARAGLDMGAAEAALQRAFWSKPASVQDAGFAKADMALFVAALPAETPWAGRLAAVRARFGDDAPRTEQTLRNWAKATAGHAPANWAFVLAPSYVGRETRADMSAEAWDEFLRRLGDGWDWTLEGAYDDVADLARKHGWKWPARSTVRRRWEDLPKAERLQIKRDAATMRKAMRQPMRRDTDDIPAGDELSMDGRVIDVWVDDDAGPYRPTITALTCIRTHKTVAFVFDRSETSDTARAVILRACEAHGKPVRIWTDNGAAFTSPAVAGAQKRRPRRAKGVTGKHEPPGLCQLLGIELLFHGPERPEAKVAERAFHTMSRAIDRAPEFKGAHAGANPGDKPAAGVKPVTLEQLEYHYGRRIAQMDAKPGRRGRACLATKCSYDEAFQRERNPVHRPLNDFERRMASLTFRARRVDQHGRITFREDGNEWLYGDGFTQEALLRFEGREVWIGFDTSNLEKPAAVFCPDTRELVAERVEYVVPGRYNSQRDAQRSAAETLRLRKLSEGFAADMAERAASPLEEVDAPAPIAAPAPGNVTRPNFSPPLKPASSRDRNTPDPYDPVLAENAARLAAARG